MALSTLRGSSRSGARAWSAGARRAARRSVGGSQLYTTHQENSELIAVRLGALDQDPGVRPNVHQFVDYAAPWAPVPDDGFPRFGERMEWR